MTAQLEAIIHDLLVFGVLVFCLVGVLLLVAWVKGPPRPTAGRRRNHHGE